MQNGGYDPPEGVRLLFRELQGVQGRSDLPEAAAVVYCIHLRGVALLYVEVGIGRTVEVQLAEQRIVGS